MSFQMDPSIPDIFTIKDEFDYLEKRYKFYILKDKGELTPNDLALDTVLCGVYGIEMIKKKIPEFKLDLYNWSKNINKNEVKKVTDTICENYFKFCPDKELEKKQNTELYMKLFLKLLMPIIKTQKNTNN